MRRYLFFLLFIFVTSAWAQSTDYLIVENPAELRILNKFEQSLGPSESARLYKFMPFERVRTYMLLSDRMTTAMLVKHGANSYFILTDTDGEPVNIRSAGAWKMYNGARPLSDTVVAALDDKMNLLIGVSPQNPIIRTLKKGEKAVRIFSWHGWIYLYLLDDRIAGWVETGVQNEAWEKLSPMTQKKTDLSAVIRDVQKIVDETNAITREIFNALNKIEPRSVRPPQWELKHENGKLICVLLPAESYRAYSESMNALRREFENALIGTPIKLRQEGSRIELYVP